MNLIYLYLILNLFIFLNYTSTRKYISMKCIIVLLILLSGSNYYNTFRDMLLSPLPFIFISLDIYFFSELLNI